ncbi:MAG: PEP-CTERM sorting domain-containing protein [Planctomycetota bacterium]
MKRLLSGIAVLAIVMAQSAHAEVVALFEDFEDSAVAYTITADGSTTVEFSDGIGDFVTRIGGDSTNTVGTFYEIFGVQGSGYFGAMDTNGEPEGGDVIELSWTGIDVSGLTDLSFSGFFAEDTDGTNEDWDDNSSFLVEAQIDGGGFVSLFAVEATGGTNSSPAVDTDFDGVGDGAAITDTLTEFSAVIGGTGSTLDLRLTISNLEAGDEDIAFDNITVAGVAAIPEPSSMAVLGLLGIGAMRSARKRRRTKNA